MARRLPALLRVLGHDELWRACRSRGFASYAAERELQFIDARLVHKLELLRTRP